MKIKIEEMEYSLKIWREEEKTVTDAWNSGYNDGFQDVFESMKKALEA